MIASNLPSNFLANPIAPQNSIGSRPVGQENVSSQIPVSKPIIQISESGRALLRMRERSIEENDIQALENGQSGRSGESAADIQDAQALREERQAALEDAQEKQQEQQDIQVIKELSARDREVRAHEQAHAAVGGQYAGAPTYQYQRGPDGVRYAVGGEVPIDVGKEATPQETLQKAQVVRRAALAPAEPSPQDRRVAAQASRMEAEARQEIQIEQREERVAQSEDAASTTDNTAEESTDVSRLAGNEVNTDIAGLVNTNDTTSPASIEFRNNLFSYPASVGARLANTVLSVQEAIPQRGSLFDQRV